MKKFFATLICAYLLPVYTGMQFKFGPPEAKAEKFYAVSSRHSTGDAKQSAQINTLSSENQQRLNENTAQDAAITDNASAISAISTTVGNMKDCGDTGKMYGPGHTQASSNCVDIFTLESGGTAAFSYGVKIGNVSACDVSAEGTLRYNSGTKAMEYCDGTAWKAFGTGGGCDYNYLGITNANLDTYYTSNTPALSGFSGSQVASVDGDSTVTIVKNGADTGLQSTSVGNGDTVGFRVKSPNLYSRVLNLTMDIGTGFTSCWQVATKDQDVTPDTFTFNDLTEQALNTLVISNVVIPSGYDAPLAVSISGQGNPKLRINGGSWVSAGDISPGDSVQLQLLSSAAYETALSATYTLGTVQGIWNVTTRPDTWISCAAAQAAGQPSGLYNIDVDGSGPGVAFEAYCDMSIQGGGWMLCQHLTEKSHFDTASNMNTVWGGTPTASSPGGIDCSQFSYSSVISEVYKGSDNLVVQDSNAVAGTSSWVSKFNSVYSNTFGCSPSRSKATVRGKGYSQWFQYYMGPFSRGRGVNYCTSRGQSWDPEDQFTIGLHGGVPSLVVRSHKCTNCCASNSCDSSSRHWTSQVLGSDVDLKIYVK